MDPLAWLGLREPEESHLAAIQRAVRDVLPDDEAVVIRYIVIVAILLTKVAYADGRLERSELDHLKALFRHIDRLLPEGIEQVCEALDDRVPELSGAELKLCYRELKSFCDGRERRQVVRMLAELARVDGKIGPSERVEIRTIGEELGLAEDELERELRVDAPSGAVKSRPPEGESGSPPARSSSSGASEPESEQGSGEPADG